MTKRVAKLLEVQVGIGYETAIALFKNDNINYNTIRDTKKGSSILNESRCKNPLSKLLNLILKYL